MSWDLPEPYIVTRRALLEHIDGYGHVNNAVYVRWLDEVAWSHSSALGLPPQVCSELGRGMAVWRTQINYLSAAFEGEDVEVGTWLLRNDGRLRIDRRFQMRRRSDGEALLRALIHYVSIDLTTGRAVRMPSVFVERYAVLPAVIVAADEDFQPGVEPARRRAAARERE